MTALMFASLSGHITTVDFLLTNGAKMIYPDKVRYALRLHCFFRQNKQVVEYCTAAVTCDVTDSEMQ
jgi:ankyrin repeat protein